MASSTSGKMTVLTCYYFSIQRSGAVQYYQHGLQCKQIGVQKGYYPHSQSRGKYVTNTKWTCDRYKSETTNNALEKDSVDV